MANIRIVRLEVKNSTNIEITFTNNLSTSVNLNNIELKSLNGSISDPAILSVNVNKNILKILVRPLVAKAYYRFVLFSTEEQRVVGSKGEFFIEDGATNVVFFIGSQEDNFIRDEILSELPRLYNAEPGTLVFDSVDTGSKELFSVRNSIGEVRSANFVSLEAIDEKKTRGFGATDRFDNEGVYQILRVGSSQTGISREGQISFEEFPEEPVNLSQVFVSEEIISNTLNANNNFNGLNITLENRPIIKVTSIVLTQDGVDYEYNIEQYRYGILDSKYDVNNSYTFLDINSNQIKLTNSAIGPDFPMPRSNDSFTISYYYEKIGRRVETDSLEIYTNIYSIREQIPSVSTSFFLNNAPIIDDNGKIPLLNGVIWLDPNQNYSTLVKHPAFKIELKYNPSNLPKSIGEFCINYETGQVFVFGSDGTGTDGTTITPPVATYFYKKVYKEDLDYVLYSDTNEVASIPVRNLRGNSAIIKFYYEDNFADGVDFNSQSHIEVINERVQNRLIDNIGIKTLHSPVNKVFKIYNETTGELYNPTRICKNEIYFNAINTPINKNVNREPAQFASSIQSELLIVDEIDVGESYFIYKINLEHNNIMAAEGGFLGASFNTSFDFSDKTIFVRELFYDRGVDLNVNLSRLELEGDYIVNYKLGIVYLARNPGSSTIIGEVSYRYGKINTRNNHILRVDDVYKSASVVLENTQIFNVYEIEDNLVSIGNLQFPEESKDLEDNVHVVEDENKIIVNYDVFKLGKLFQVTDLKTKFDPINFSQGAVISSNEKNVIILNPKGVLIEDTTLITIGPEGYINAPRIQSLFDGGLVELVSAVSVVDSVYGTDYYVQGPGSYVDPSTNRIYLHSPVIGSTVYATYMVRLKPGAAVLVNYSTGNVYINYTYCPDEIIVSYEYGDNVLDWSISGALNPEDTYYVSYRYGALRDSLRDNFGVLTGIEELSNISDNLSRETYRSALMGSLQSFPKGPTPIAIKELIKAFTKIYPNITESIFLEWVLGRDYLNLSELKIEANSFDELPKYLPGKFGKGIYMSLPGQKATLPVNSNLPLNEGTFECFVIPDWDGIANDSDVTFDLLFDGYRKTEKIFIGSSNVNPETIPFKLNIDDPQVLGIPSLLHDETGFFIWYDMSAKLWRVRSRAPISENRVCSGTIISSGEFYKVRVAKTASGDEDYEDSSQQINELNDVLRSTKDKIYFSFVIDSNDYLNTNFDAYDSYGASFAGFDGIDFTANDVHYLLDTSDSNCCRFSLFKDGHGFLKFRVIDKNGSHKILSTDISNWYKSEIHHIAISWKINTIEQKDEMHLFVDGFEVPNIYRFGGYLNPKENSVFMDSVSEKLNEPISSPVVGGFDLQTTTGSNLVVSDIDFIGRGVSIGSRFVILEENSDGERTKLEPYVFVKNILTNNVLELETGLGENFYCNLSLNNVWFTINPLTLKTNTNPQVEKVKVFSVNSSLDEIELNSPLSINPDYNFSKDGYVDYINIYNGINIGDFAVAKTFGLNITRHKQNAYIWSNGKLNIINTKLPVPISISKINITKILVNPVVISSGSFSIIATDHGGHFLLTLNSNLDSCQPSNSITGRRLTVSIRGNNFAFEGINKFIFIGETTDGYDFEELVFTQPGSQSTTRYFTKIYDTVASFTPIDIHKPVGSVEVRETLPLNLPDNNGDYAEIYLSVQQAVGSDGYALIGTKTIEDPFGRFDEEDIGKTFNILSPIEIAGVYKIKDVYLDPSETIKDSNTVVLEGNVWLDSYSDIKWQLINTSFGDSGFANGLITLELANSGGEPFLLNKCWYEIDLPTYLTIPWNKTPDLMYIGSNNNGNNQFEGVIDELRILNEMSLDTSLWEELPSSGRSITTDALAVREYSPTPQTLVLFHFDDDNVNFAPFYNNYLKFFRQSENSVNENFGQSAVFNIKKAYKIDNKGIFNNNKGTIEFWVSPILDTFNDPTKRYYIDLSPEQIVKGEVITNSVIQLSSRARSVNSINIKGSDKNYFIGGTLDSSGSIITLSRPLPVGTKTVDVRIVPITSQGDRFSIFKDENGNLSLFVSASGVEYQITSPVYWKKNSWHRVFVEWSFNNVDNRDRLVLMVDGTESGMIRYGTGLLYGDDFVYGQQNIWGSDLIGTASSRNIVADINLIDIFNTIYIGADFTEQHSALARMDNIRFSSEPRSIVYMGGQGPGRLIGKDLLFSSNINVVHPVVSDAITRLLLNFNTEISKVEHLAIIRNKVRGIFDFYIDVIDTFNLADSTLTKELIVNLINRLKPAHTRAFVRFIK